MESFPDEIQREGGGWGVEGGERVEGRGYKKEGGGQIHAEREDGVREGRTDEFRERKG